jgi:hypothetical protein
MIYKVGRDLDSPLKLPINLSITPLNFLSRDFESLLLNGDLVKDGDCKLDRVFSPPLSVWSRLVVTNLGKFVIILSLGHVV